MFLANNHNLFQNTCHDSIKENNSAVQHTTTEQTGGPFVLDPNKSIIDQISQKYTIYEIRSKFDLQGAFIKMPEGCSLLFNGGILKNGTICGDNTVIIAGLQQIFNEDICLLGKWNVNEAYPEWFGARGDGVKDDRVAIQKTVDCFSHTVLSSKQYLINSTNSNKIGIELSKGKKLTGTRLYSSTLLDDQKDCSIIVGSKIDILSVIRITTLCELSSIGIIGNRVNERSTCVSSDQSSRIILNNVATAGSFFGFDLQSYLTRIHSCIASSCEIGYSIHGGGVHNTSNTLESCFAVNCSKYGYYFNLMTYSTIISCAADGCGTSNLTNIGYAYCLNQCDNMSFISCGSEQCIKPLFCHQCIGILFSHCNYQVGSHYLKLPDDYNLTDIITLRYSAHITIDDCVIDYSGLSDKISTKGRLIHLTGKEVDFIVLTYIPSVVSPISLENIGVSGYLVKDKNLRYVHVDNFLKSGSSKQRPNFKNKSGFDGYMFFDTTINKPLWWDGKKWIDAQGASYY